MNTEASIAIHTKKLLCSSNDTDRIQKELLPAERSPIPRYRIRKIEFTSVKNKKQNENSHSHPHHQKRSTLSKDITSSCLVVIIAGELFDGSEVLLHVHQIHPWHLVKDITHATGVQTLHSEKETK